MPLAAIARRKARDRDPRQIDEGGVEEGGVLALEEADAAQIVRQGDRGLRAFLGEDRPRPLFAGGVERREDRGDRDRPDAALADLPRRPPHAGLVERHDRPAVVIVPAFEHEHLAADRAGKILRPVAERRQ